MFDRHIEAAAPGNQPVSDQDAATGRAIAASMSKLAIDGLERAYGLSGGQGVYDGDASRAYRDARAGYQHTALNPTGAAKDAGLFLTNESMNGIR